MFPFPMLHCIICGAVILNQDEPKSKSISWLRQYRAVYYSSSGARISGVGLRRRPDNPEYYRVPIDDTKRWDDKGCRSTYVPVLTQENGKYGFVFHDSCWYILQARSQSQGTAMPLDRLIEVLNSVPLDSGSSRTEDEFDKNFYIWEHGYQGLAWFDHYSHCPWEKSGWRRGLTQSSAVQNSTQDPCCLQEIQELLDKDSISPPPPSRCSVVRGNGERWAYDDCFARLPYEIVEEIASYLPTASVFSLRLASRAFTSLFFSQVFWATRFQADGERGFLFETQRRPSLGCCDWRSLYHLSNTTNAPPALQNRKRIWDLIGSLLEKVSLKWTNASFRRRIVKKLPEWRWKDIHGDLVEIGPCSGNYDSSEMVDQQETLLPSRIVRIGASVVCEGEKSYIAGIQFVSREDGEMVCLGYTSPETSTFVDVTCVRGLILSVGSRGIHALQAVDSDGSLLPWLGRPDGGAISRRFVYKEQIVALSAGFDGYKLLHLSAWGKNKPVPKESKPYDLFMNYMLWFPDTPKPDMHLNESSFIGHQEKKTEFRPICCSLFGGPGGVFLPLITGVFVVFKDFVMVDIEFRYTNDSVNIPPTCRRLHRCKRGDGLHTMYFDINGPGGEFIETVDFAILRGLKISTNWKRSFSFIRRDAAEVSKEWVPRYRRIEIAPGTIPIGFYECHHNWWRHKEIDSLGIISASLPRSSTSPFY